MKSQGNQMSNARIFEPYEYHSDLYHLPDTTKSEFFGPANIVHFNPEAGISNLMLYLPLKHSPYVSRFMEVQESIIIIAVDGVRQVEGTVTASFGVWFGTTSPYNANGLLPTDLPRTTQAAELYAVKTALQTIRDKIQSCPNTKNLDHIIIMTESPYIRDSISRDIWKWESNGYMTARKTPVANSDALKEVHELVKVLEEKKVTVKFWLIEREFNLPDARRLSLKALGVEEVDIPDAKKKKPNKKQKKKKQASASGSVIGADDGDTKDGINDSDPNDSDINTVPG